MEFNFSPWRLALLLSLIVVFWLLGGFQKPVLPPDGALDAQRVTKAWFYCIMMFLGGASSVSIIDHYVGNLERSNLRLLYIIVGMFLMLAGFFWAKALKRSAGQVEMTAEVRQAAEQWAVIHRWN